MRVSRIKSDHLPFLEASLLTFIRNYIGCARYAIVVLAFLGSVNIGLAAQSYEGSWADSQENCSSPIDSNLRIAGNRYFEHEGSCTIGSTKGHKGTWVLFLTCEGEGEQWKKVVTLEPMGDKMRLGGDRGPVLQRCRKSARPPNWPQ